MKYLFLTFILLLFVAHASSGVGLAQSPNSESIDEMLEKANNLHMTGEEQESLDVYLDVLDRDSDNLEALWNATVLHTKIGHRKDSEEEMADHYEKAGELADRALEHHGDSGYAFYAKAVATARMTEILDTGDKIEASHEIKENIEKASERLPDFAPVWHLYGVWHSDVANTSSAEKMAAGLFSKGVPDASNDKAEEYLLKATEMDEENILFLQDLAKHYLKVDKPEKAKEVLSKILEVEPVMKDDEAYQQEAKDLLSDL